MKPPKKQSYPAQKKRTKSIKVTLTPPGFSQETQGDDALLEMQDDQLILTHNERGEIFPAKVKQNQQGTDFLV